jgi:phosphohistidine phosphatase
LKKIILIRHAKSSWDYNYSDLKRPLSNRGYNDADIMSMIFKNFKLNIDSIYSSSARRALDTANKFLNNLNYNVKLIIEPNLYDFDGKATEKFIKCLDDSYNSVMIFSHNNTCSNLYKKYTYHKNLHVPTCGILIFEFDVSLWADIKNGKCTYYFPKNFR